MLIDLKKIIQLVCKTYIGRLWVNKLKCNSIQKNRSEFTTQH